MRGEHLWVIPSREAQIQTATRRRLHIARTTSVLLISFNAEQTSGTKETHYRIPHVCSNAFTNFEIVTAVLSYT